MQNHVYYKFEYLKCNKDIMQWDIYDLFLIYIILSSYLHISTVLKYTITLNSYNNNVVNKICS